MELRGVIEPVEGEDDVLLADVSVEGEGVSHRGRTRAPFVLRTEDGRAVAVDPKDAELEGPPHALEESGHFRGVKASAIGPLLEGFSAGPHFEVKAHARRFAKGDCVTVVGEPSERDGGDGYRDGPGEVVAVHATQIRGRGAKPEPRRGPETASRGARAEPRQPLVGDAVIATLGVVAVAVATSALSPWSHEQAVLRAATLACGLVALWCAAARHLGQAHLAPEAERRFFVPDFRGRSQGELHARGDHVLALLAPAVLLGTGVGYVVQDQLSLAGLGGGYLGPPSEQGLDHLAIALFAVPPLVLAVHSLFATRRARRIARMMLGTPTRRGLAAGYLAMEGVVEDGVARRIVELVNRSEEVRDNAGKTRTKRTVRQRPRLERSPTLKVATAAGVLEVELKDALVGTTRWRYLVEDEVRSTHRFELARGDRVLVVGDFAEGSLRLASTGPETVIVLGTGTSAPRATLVLRALAEHSVWLLLAASIGAGYVWWMGVG